MTGYFSLVRLPHVARILLGTLVGRLPSAMAALSIPLVLRGVGAGYGFVGTAAGTYAVAAAVGGPLLGRLVDRIGQPRVLLASSAAGGVGLAVIALAPRDQAAVLIGALIAGASTPPLEPCLRALWPDLVPAERLESAYAADSASQELIFIGGPLVVTACVAAGSRTAALWVGAVLGVVGVLAVASAPPTRAWRAAQRSDDWLGPLRSGGLAVLLTGLIGVGVAIGTLSVLMIAYAEHRHVPGGAPTMLALNAAGAFAGGLGYGALRWSGPPARRILLLASGLTGAYALLCLMPGPAWMALLMLLTGLFLAPLLTAVFVLVGELAPAGTVTEAFAWLVTLITAGTAAGAAVTGVLLQHASQSWAAFGGAAGAGAGVVVLWLGRRRLTVPDPAGAQVPTLV